MIFILTFSSEMRICNVTTHNDTIGFPNIRFSKLLVWTFHDTTLSWSCIFPHSTRMLTGAAGMLFHLVMGYLTKALASHISIWQPLIQQQEMHWKTIGPHSQSVSTHLELVAKQTQRALFVLKSLSQERYDPKSSTLSLLSLLHFV